MNAECNIVSTLQNTKCWCRCYLTTYAEIFICDFFCNKLLINFRAYCVLLLPRRGLAAVSKHGQYETEFAFEGRVKVSLFWLTKVGANDERRFLSRKLCLKLCGKQYFTDLPKCSLFIASDSSDASCKLDSEFSAVEIKFDAIA